MNELSKNDTKKEHLTRRPEGVWMRVRPANAGGQKQPYSDHN